MAFDPAMADEIRDALRDHAGLSEKKMFGGLIFMYFGNMLCGVQGDRFMMRVGKEALDFALQQPGTEQVNLGGNRPLSGFVWVEHEYCTGESLQWWLDLVLEFVGALEPK